MDPRDDASIPAPATDLDRVVHEPARLSVLAILSVVDHADFVFLRAQTGLTLGNLSSHLSKLEEAGYISVQKSFAGKKPRTTLRLTPTGQEALLAYRERMEEILSELPK